MGHPARVVVVPAVQGGGGRGTELSALSLPGSCSRSVGYLRTVIPRRRHRRWGLGGGERPRRRLPGAEAATEEAAAAVILTCFDVGCGLFLVWWRCGVCAGK